MKNERLYLIMATLDEPMRIVGMTLDEAVGVISFVLIGVYEGTMMIGIIGAALYMGAIKALKNGRGSGWVLALMYWYLPDKLTKIIIRSLPASYHRKWLC